MYLGIEIGGTKLQIAVGTAEEPSFVELVRLKIDPARGAAGIRDQLAPVVAELARKYPLRAAGIGFGGPVDGVRGTTTKSHQIHGWEDFPLGAWLQQIAGVPVALGNDCDVATLAEATLGAGRGHRSVFYVTVGTGVGGGCVLDGVLLGSGRPAIAEIGHLRPGLGAREAEDTVESRASGWGIARTARELVQQSSGEASGDLTSATSDREQLLEACYGDLRSLTAEQIAAAAGQGNALAQQALGRGIETLGWGIAQVVTLLAPEVIVIGGGVSLIGERAYLAPLRAAIERFVFPPLRASFELRPAALGESVVVHGAVLLAQQSDRRLDGGV